MNETDISTLVSSLSCPITHQVMTDPVQGNDGQTYERSAIVRWLSTHNTSPLTHQRMTVDDLKVNAAIRFLVDKYHSGQFGNSGDDDGDGGGSSGSGVGGRDNSNSIDVGMVKLKSSIFNGRAACAEGNKVMFTFEADTDTIPEHLRGKTFPQDVVCVVDRSGSMQVNVEAKDDDGKQLEDGLSQLDLVKYAIKTIGATLKSTDRLAIVSFDNTIQTEVGLTEITEMNFTTVSGIVDSISPGGSTNIWQAIEKALGLLNERSDKSRNAHVIVLTDGVPNTGRPARGEVATLARLRKTLNFSASINTIGFGYDLEEGLLYGLSKVANGVTAHMPDGGMIASVFNHLISTILCTVAMNLQLEVKLTGSILFADPPVCGDFNYDIEDSVLKIDVGTVQQQQSRNVILNILVGDNVASYIQDNIHYNYSYKVGNVVTKTSEKNLVGCEETKILIEPQLTRCFVVEKILEAVEAKTLELTGRWYKRSTGCPPQQRVVTSKDIYNEIVEYFESNSHLTDKLSAGIFDSLTDQVRLALSTEDEHKTMYRSREMSYFKKWGYSYIAQLCSHINNEKRANYKDSACENFGGELFHSVVDYASDKFDTLPPPVPSNRVSGRAAATMHGGPPAPTRVSTDSYNSRSRSSGVCFAGHCRILLSDGSDIMVKDLRKNDSVLTLVHHTNQNTTTTARVVCILKTILPDNMEIPMVNLSGLIITGNHPVFVDNKWQYPCQVSSVHKVMCTELYSLVLDGGHVAIVNDIPCICLGHNFETGILKHNYLGTNAVVNDLMKMPGWDGGLIENRVQCGASVEDTVERDPDGYIRKIKYL